MKIKDIKDIIFAIRLRHFLKPDHISFILILPLIFINQIAATILWFFSLFYDVYEEIKRSK